MSIEGTFAVRVPEPLHGITAGDCEMLGVHCAEMVAAVSTQPKNSRSFFIVIELRLNAGLPPAQKDNYSITNIDQIIEKLVGNAFLLHPMMQIVN